MFIYGAGRISSNKKASPTSWLQIHQQINYAHFLQGEDIMMKILLQLMYASPTHKHDPLYSVNDDFEGRVMWAVNQPIALLLPAFRQYILDWCSPDKRTVSLSKQLYERQYVKSFNPQL